MTVRACCPNRKFRRRVRIYLRKNLTIALYDQGCAIEISLLCNACVASSSCCKPELFFLRCSSAFTASLTSELSISLRYGVLALSYFFMSFASIRCFEINNLNAEHRGTVLNISHCMCNPARMTVVPNRNEFFALQKTCSQSSRQ